MREEESAECAICLVASGDLSSPLGTTHCGHRFCDSCLSRYALQREMVTCPVCRAPLTTSDMPSDVAHGVRIELTFNEAVGIQFESSPQAECATIQSVALGSAAQRAGFRPGMEVLAINDERLLASESVDPHALAVRLRGAAMAGTCCVAVRLPSKFALPAER